MVERELVRLQRLIDDLFTLARAEVQQLPLTLAPTDIGALLARSVDALAPGAWSRGRVELIAEPAELPLVAQADEGRLEQVLRNLVLNAVRHTPPGGVVVLAAQAVDDAVVVIAAAVNASGATGYRDDRHPACPAAMVTFGRGRIGLEALCYGWACGRRRSKLERRWQPPTHVCCPADGGGPGHLEAGGLHGIECAPTR